MQLSGTCFIVVCRASGKQITRLFRIGVASKCDTDNKVLDLELSAFTG